MVVDIAKRDVEAFLEMLLAEKNLAKNTLEAYRRDITDFINYFTLQRKILDELNVHDVSDYLESLRKKSFANSTIARRLSGLKHYYRFLLSEGRVLKDPFALIETPKQERILPRILSEDEISSLLNAAHRKSDVEGVRLACLLEILYASGLRVSELVSLPYSVVRTINFQEQISSMIVQGKGSKERMVPLSKAALDSLQAYLSVRKNFLSSKTSEVWLFSSNSKEGHLTRQRFGQLLKEIAVNAGIAPYKVSPHVVRHAFASHMLHHGADLMSIQKLLGHSDVSTTEIYTHVLGEKLKSVVLTHHPLSRVQKEPK